MSKRTRARSYIWHWPDRDEPGVMLTRGGRMFFIPAQDLYRVSDLLVDHAETLDPKETP